MSTQGPDVTYGRLYKVYVGTSCSLSPSSTLIHSSFTNLENVPESVNDGLWITGQTSAFTTLELGGRVVVLVVKEEEGSEVIGCSRIQLKSTVRLKESHEPRLK